SGQGEHRDGGDRRQLQGDRDRVRKLGDFDDSRPGFERSRRSHGVASGRELEHRRDRHQKEQAHDQKDDATEDLQLDSARPHQRTGSWATSPPRRGGLMPQQQASASDAKAAWGQIAHRSHLEVLRCSKEYSTGTTVTMMIIERASASASPGWARPVSLVSRLLIARGTMMLPCETSAAAVA